MKRLAASRARAALSPFLYPHARRFAGVRGGGVIRTHTVEPSFAIAKVDFPGNFDPQPEFVLGREENLFPPAPPPIVGGVSAKLRDTVWLISRTHLCGGSIPPGRPSPRVIQQEFKHGGFRSLQRGSAQYALSPSSLSEGSYRPDLVS